jgi:hypothetical protein
MPRSNGLTLAVALLAGLSLHAAAQGPSPKTEARFVGGFKPDACRYPSEQRRQGISACCIMDLDIDADGRVLKSDGSCTDAAFLLPTQRCLAAQDFVPATANGRAVRAPHTLEYEWRANAPSDGSLCKRLKTS